MKEVELYGNKWKKTDKIPFGREDSNIWKVIECPLFTLYMDNVYGEMFLQKPDGEVLTTYM